MLPFVSVGLFANSASPMFYQVLIEENHRDKPNIVRISKNRWPFYGSGCYVAQRFYEEDAWLGIVPNYESFKISLFS